MVSRPTWTAQQTAVCIPDLVRALERLDPTFRINCKNRTRLLAQIPLVQWDIVGTGLPVGIIAIEARCGELDLHPTLDLDPTLPPPPKSAGWDPRAPEHCFAQAEGGLSKPGCRENGTRIG
jgi:hypothetical protein